MPDVVNAAFVLDMQRKLYRWSEEDPHKVFDDLFNLVCDRRTLSEAWQKLARNSGSRTPGTDGMTRRSVEQRAGGAARLLDEIREALRNANYHPEPVRQRLIPRSRRSAISSENCAQNTLNSSANWWSRSVPTCWMRRRSPACFSPGSKATTSRGGRRGVNGALPTFTQSAEPLRKAIDLSRRAMVRLRQARHRLDRERMRHDKRDWVMKWRERTRQLIELGGLVAKAGLVELTDDDRAAIYGGMLELAASLKGDDRDSKLALMRRRGKRAFESDANSQVEAVPPRD